MTPLDRPAIKSEAGNSDACYLTISGLRKRFGDASVLDDLSLVAYSPILRGAYDDPAKRDGAC